jgi:Protein of unknown function (DUF3365)
MPSRPFWAGLTVGILGTSLLGLGGLTAASKASDGGRCLPVEMAADHLHSLIQADRTFYTTEVVERMQMRGVVFAGENWREAGKLPLPAQFLMESGRLMAAEHSGLRYRLISSWAINKQNGPASEFERLGLKAIQANHDRPYTAVTVERGRRVFQALYADRAVSQSCVGCHNGHENSPKRDFRRGDVMGGILLTIPLPPE